MELCKNNTCIQILETYDCCIRLIIHTGGQKREMAILKCQRNKKNCFHFNKKKEKKRKNWSSRLYVMLAL